MDFSQHQNKAKGKTFQLGCLYVVGLFVLTIVTCIAAVIITGGGADGGMLLLLCLVGVPVLVIGGSLFKSAQLSSGGGRAVAESLGGRLVNPSSADPAERLVYEVAEETARVAGVQVPALYILPNEPGINAFAAGLSLKDAAIGFTRGSVELFTRDELKGVMAHEFAHVLNGDMRISTRLMGITFGLGLLAFVGSNLMFLAGRAPSQNQSRGGAAYWAIGLALWIIGWIGIVFSSLMQLAVSRQREFLADASAVQLARNPRGIADALKKIGSPKVGSGVGNKHAAEASHLFFGDVGFFSLGGLLSTHPDLATRIKRIEPNFDGRFPEQLNPVRTLGTRGT